MYVVFTYVCIFNYYLHFISKVILLYSGRFIVWLLFCRKFVSYLHNKNFYIDVCMFTLLKNNFLFIIHYTNTCICTLMHTYIHPGLLTLMCLTPLTLQRFPIDQLIKAYLTDYKCIYCVCIDVCVVKYAGLIKQEHYQVGTPASRQIFAQSPMHLYIYLCTYASNYEC